MSDSARWCEKCQAHGDHHTDRHPSDDDYRLSDAELNMCAHYGMGASRPLAREVQELRQQAAELRAEAIRLTRELMRANGLSAEMYRTERALADQAIHHIRELLLAGTHDGPCDEDSHLYGCDAHLKASDGRRTEAKDFLAAWEAARHE